MRRRQRRPRAVRRIAAAPRLLAPRVQPPADETELLFGLGWTVPDYDVHIAD
jgi:hypothetical protein